MEGTGPKQAELCQILQPLNTSESLFVYSLAHSGGFELRSEECVQKKGVHVKRYEQKTCRLNLSSARSTQSVHDLLVFCSAAKQRPRATILLPESEL